MGGGFQCLIGASQWDAVAYVRASTGDLDSGLAQSIPDSSYQIYAEAIAEKFSRCCPLGEFVIGAPGANPQTSPINTVAGQQRYVLSPAFLTANGLPACMEVTDVLYRVGVSILAGADLAFFLLIPSSPLGRFVLDPTQPTMRVLRDAYLNELDHYGVGWWTREYDANGNPAIDLWPIPQQTGLPVLVRYKAQHVATQLNDGYSSVSYPTVPEHKKQLWGDLLFAHVLLQEARKVAVRGASSKAGIIERRSSPAGLLALALELRDRTEQALGSTAPIISRGRE